MRKLSIPKVPGFELIDDLERNAVNTVFDEGGTLFAHGFDSRRKRFHVREFESECESYFSTTHANALSSGTASLKCALKALGVQPGDEVITQSFNFIATIEAIVDVGAIPVIVNVDENLHIDLSDVRSKLTPNTKCIIIVHMLGMPGPVEQLIHLSNAHNIPVIEDACEAVGGRIHGRYAGTLSDIGVFSFDHGKNITCGEGGLTLTDNLDLHRYISSYSDHGHAFLPYLGRGQDKANFPGFNYRMTELQAAVGKVQLTKLSTLVGLNLQRYSILDATLQSKYRVRQAPTAHHITSGDTFVIVGLTQSQVASIIQLLTDIGIGTKNVPDAMNWHCSYYWNHALSENDTSHSKRTDTYLKASVAIPILVSKSVEFYTELSHQILSL